MLADCIVCWHDPFIIEIVAQPIILRVYEISLNRRQHDLNLLRPAIRLRNEHRGAWTSAGHEVCDKGNNGRVFCDLTTRREIEPAARESERKHGE
jgi:hypothetical protein